MVDVAAPSDVAATNEDAEPAARSHRATTPRPRSRWRPDSVHLALALVVVVGALLRLFGTRFGFPLLVHPDESAVVDPIVDMAKRHSFEPTAYLRPDHLEMKVDYLLYRVYAHFDGQSIPRSFADNPVPYYWIARLMTAAYGIASVVLGYLIGARYARWLGVIAAALIACYPLLVRDAHYVTPDVPLTACTMLMIYALMRYWSTPRRRPLLLACFALAMAVTLKYPGAVGAAMIGLIIVIKAVPERAWKRMVRHLIGAAGASLGFTFLISPTLFTNLGEVRRELSIQSAGGRLGHPDFGLFGNMRFYVETFANYSGVLILALAVLGAVVAVRRRWGACIPWLVGLLFWVALSTLPLTWERWGLPMFVAPLLFAAVGLHFLFQKLRTGLVRAVPIAVAAIVALQLLSSSLGIVAGLTENDTRLASLDYVKQANITRSETTYEGYSPFLPGVSKLFFDQVTPDGAGGFTFRTKAGVPAKYVIISSGMYSRVFADPTYADKRPIYTWLFTHAKEIKRFAPLAAPPPSVLEPESIVDNLDYLSDATSGGLNGPLIRIFELPAAP